jgi:UDP-N-acetylglucosamine 2-epimerase
MKKKQILFIAGTRPEIIKLAPVVLAAMGQRAQHLVARFYTNEHVADRYRQLLHRVAKGESVNIRS